MSRWQSAGWRTFGRAHGRMAGRHGGIWHCADRTGAGTAALRKAILAVFIGARASLDVPLVAFSLQHILHGHAGAGRGIAFRLKSDRGSGFILAIGYRGHVDIHGQQVGALGEVVHDALANGIVIFDIFFAAAQQGDGQAESGDGDGWAFHNPIIAGAALSTGDRFKRQKCVADRITTQPTSSGHDRKGHRSHCQCSCRSLSGNLGVVIE